MEIFITKYFMLPSEHYYKHLLDLCDGYTVQGLFSGNRSVDKIVTLQTGNKGKIFFFDQEPMIKDLDQELWNYIFIEPTIFANSELDSTDKAYLQASYPNFIDWYYFSNALASLEWLSDYRYLKAGWSDFKPCLYDSNLATGYRQYRLLLMYLLIKEELHLVSNISFNGNQDWHQDLLNYDHLGLLDIDDFCETLSGFNTSYDNFGSFKNNKQRLLQQYISLDHYSESNLILVSETIFTENKKHLTEKIFKPIASGKPFVLAGGVNNLDYLKSYGFETFDTCWNECYNNVTLPFDRAKAIIDTVIDTALPNRHKFTTDELYNNALHFKIERINAAHHIANSNRRYFWSNDFYSKLMQEAVNNLERAKAELASKRV